MKFWSRPLWSGLFPRVSGVARARRRYTGQLTTLEQLESREMLTGFLVTSTADTTDAGTLRWAIEQANESIGPDTITFDSSFETPQTIVLTAGPLPEFSDTTGATTVFGPGSDRFTIGGNSHFQVFSVASDVAVSISGVRIADGHSFADGGAISSAGQLTLSDVVMSENFAEVRGGAIYNTGLLIISDSRIEISTAIVGGAIFTQGTMIASHVEFANNSSTNDGGAIYSAGTTSLSYCLIEDNSTGPIGRGGGVYQDVGITGASALSISYSTLGHNSAFYGGGLSSSGSSNVIVSSSAVIYNNARTGAGIDNGGNLQLLNSTLAHNTAQWVGGGLYNSGPLEVTNSTISANTAVLLGAGISQSTYASSAALFNTIVAGNWLGDIADNIAGEVDGQRSFNNLIGPGTQNSSLTAATFNIRLDADDFVGLAPLGLYGGPTQSMPLLAGSPAVDRGNIFHPTDAHYGYDQRGLGFHRVNGTDIDIGAVESNFAAGWVSRGENQDISRVAYVYNLLGPSPYTYTIAGEDGALFAVNPDTHFLNFKTLPDYENPQDSNHDNVYRFQVTITDGDGANQVVPWIVTVENGFEPSAITLASEPAVYQIGDTRLTDNTATFTADMETTRFDGARLVVSISENRDPKDVLKVVAQGSDGGAFSLRGKNVLYGRLAFGKIQGGTKSHPDLVITFDHRARLANINALVKQISFSTKNNTLPQPSRTLRMLVIDASGYENPAATRQINVVARTASLHSSASAKRLARGH